MGRAGSVKAIALLTWAVLLTPTAGDAATPLGAVCKAATIAEFPVAIEGRRPLVKATVNGVELSFLADSGAIFSMVSPASATRVGLTLRSAPAGFALGGIGGSVDARVATVRRFGLAGLTLSDVDFFVGGSETGAAGLLGQNVLGIADTDYDLAGGMIRLVRGGGCPDSVMRDAVSGRPASAIGLEPQTRSQRHIAGLASLNGIGLRAVFDTGAPTTLLSLEAARRAGIGQGDSGVLPAGTTNGLGGAITQSWLAPGLHYRLGEVEMRGDVLRIADLGTGTGAIALALALERPCANVLATDASQGALAVARRNAAALGASNVRFAHGNWHDALGHAHFDLIASNPPYIAAGDAHLTAGDLRFEPPSALASGDDGLDAIREIASGAPSHLEANGWLLLEHGLDQGESVRALLQQAGFADVQTTRDLEGRERVSSGRWPGRRCAA